MSDLIDTTEMYLRTIYELIEDGVTPMRARIAEQLGHAGPTVSQTIARMERDGLVIVSGDRHLELTAEGEAIAVRVMRKHRLAELLLTDVVGLELPYVHEEACRWEHVMSDRVERRLLEILGNPQVSPYGNPIPGLAELGMSEEAAKSAPGVSLNQIILDGVTEVTLVRIGENPQAALGFLDESVKAGLVPGATLRVEAADDDVLVTTDNGTVTITHEAARHVFVRAH
ncbi:metal-dependent transcriptional regulator [Demequina oxidasica]|uniref:metal-dependent transcriptional regulator n=1 Tax=Demequina oxidasica TaxID=676199 RepID=UPI000781A6B3|nr:metal-dependent transcriptional regulator [Demequina oxidasica]